MEFKFKEGFMPKYYKTLEGNLFQRKVKKYLCLFFVANMIVVPITVSKINKIQDMNYKKTKENSVITMKSLSKENVKSINIEHLTYIMSTVRENLLEIKYENEKIFFKGKFKSQDEGEKLIGQIKTILKKSFNYSSNLVEEAYIFNVSEE